MSLPRNKKLPKQGNGPKPANKGEAKAERVPDKNKSGSNLYGGVGGYKGVNKKKVKRLTKGLLREEVRDLRKQRRQIKHDSKQAAQGIRTDYRRGVGDLDYVHGETADYLANLTNQNQQMYAGAMDQSAAAQAALQAQLGGTYSGAAQGGSSELARLGIQGGGSFDQLNADAGFAQSMAAQSGANAQSTLGMAGANSAAGMQMLQGMNQGSYMQGLGQNLNARNDAMAEVRSNKMHNFNEVRNAVQEAKSSRRDMFFQLLQQLQQTGWDQYIQQQQLQMQQQQHRKSMKR